MTEIRPASDELRAAVARRLKARNAAERRFQLYGRIAIAVALGFLLLLLGRIVQQGWSTFVDYRLTAQVYVDPARIDPADPGGANYDLMIAEQLLKRIGVADDEFGTRSDAMKALLSGDLGFQVLDRVKADPSVIGKTLTLSAPLKADAGLYFKGQITRATPEDERPLTSEQLDWLDRLNAGGLVKSEFNTTFLTRSDSTEPEQAGVLGAVVGSALMLLLTAALAIPIGVLAATYLEEFAPKNRWTDMVEVNHRLRPAGSGGLHQLDERTEVLPPCRRPGPGPDVPADGDHRHPVRAQGGSSVDPRGGPGPRRLPDPDRLPPCPAPGSARGDDRGHPVSRPRPGGDRAAADGGHGLLRAGGPRRLDLGQYGPSGPDLHLGERLRARLPGTHGRRHHGAAGLHDHYESRRRPAEAPVRTPLVTR
jgi:hypothetical protein